MSTNSNIDVVKETYISRVWAVTFGGNTVWHACTGGPMYVMLGTMKLYLMKAISATFHVMES